MVISRDLVLEWLSSAIKIRLILDSEDVLDEVAFWLILFLTTPRN